MNVSDRNRRRAELKLLYRVFDLPDAERVERIVEVERGDAELACALRRLLTAADAVAAQVSVAKPAQPDPYRIGPDTRIGAHFRLLHLLGAGGMGEVYLARRSDGIEQQVAIKILHGGGLALSRARREQQILAKLVHPNIAGLIDAGLTESGRPWFAMDYVDGKRLLDWCDHRSLGVVDRARLFAQICRAVQFAHRNLILHRDLKPSNILIDQEGVPKLLDFGIAKVIDVDDPHETRTLAFTPAYAAPEQLRGEPATTASDVYQLGIVLYELASGVPAHLARDTATQTGDVALALPRPHQAFAACALRDKGAAERIAYTRSSTIDKLSRALKGDLGRIIAKATTQRPSERYDTAQAFADDLERWLAGAPVSAHRGTLAYRASRLVRRHVVASATIAALVIGLLGVSGFALDRANRERLQRMQADQQRDLAQQQRARSEALLGFLRNVFQQYDPENADTSKLNVAELLDRARVSLDQRTDVDGTTRAILFTEVAKAFANLDQPQSGLAPAQRALELLTPQREQHAVDYLQSADSLLTLYSFLGRYQESVDLIDQALPLARQTPTGEHAWQPYLLMRRGYANVMLDQTQAAETDVRAAIAELEKSSDLGSPDGIEALNVLGNVFSARGAYRQAIDVEQRIIDMSAHDSRIKKSQLLTVRLNWGKDLYSQGEATRAITVLERAVAETEAMVGAQHLGTIFGKSTLVQCYLAIGEPGRARPLLDQLLAVPRTQTTQYGKTLLYIGVAVARYDLAIGRFDDALAQATRVLDAAGKAGHISSRQVDLRRLRGEAQLQLGSIRTAAATFDRVLAQARVASDGAATRATAATEDSIGRLRLIGRDFKGAMGHLQHAAEQFRLIQGADKPDTLRSEIHLLWARALDTRDPRLLDQLADKRLALVAALGGEEKLQIWQLDRLLDHLSRQLGRPGIDAARGTRAENGLRGLARADAIPRYVGLSEF